MDEAALVAEARALDPDRTLCALFAPPARRAELLGLILLDSELARIPDLVTQPLAGMIRFQWWRDSVAAIGDEAAPPVPALRALAPAIHRGAIDRAALVKLIDARADDLERIEPSDSAALEAYLASTAGLVSELMARCLGCSEARITAAGEIGTAWGLLGIARAFAAEAKSRELSAEPGALLERAGVLLVSARTRVGRPQREELAPFLLYRLVEMQRSILRRTSSSSTDMPRRPPWASLVLLWAWATRRV